MGSKPAILRPKALQPGDIVSVAALSSPLETAELEMYERAIATLESLGFRVRPAPLVDVAKVWWWAAAPPVDVGRELNELFRDPENKAIWALATVRNSTPCLGVIDRSHSPRTHVRAVPTSKVIGVTLETG